MRILSYILFIFIFLLSCNTEKNKVEKVATQYLQYLKDKNYEEAKKMQTEECYGLLSCASEFGADFKITEIKNVKCEVKENEAQCKFCCSDTNYLNNQILLKKINGKWFIHCNKESPPCYDQDYIEKNQ